MTVELTKNAIEVFNKIKGLTKFTQLEAAKACGKVTTIPEKVAKDGHKIPARESGIAVSSALTQMKKAGMLTDSKVDGKTVYTWAAGAQQAQVKERVSK